MERTVSSVGLALVLAVSGTACGGDGELTKAKFVAKVNAACTPFQDRTNQLFEDGFPTTEAKLQPFFEKLTPIVESQVEAIRSTDPPKGEEAAVAEIVKAGEATVADFKKATADAATATALFDDEGGENARAFEKKATAYGLNDCVDDEDAGEDEPLLDPSTFSPEKQAYVLKADQICAAADERLTAIEDATFETFPPPLEKWAAFLPALVEVYDGAVRDLKAIPPPPGDEATLSALYSDLEAQLARVMAATDFATAGQQAEFDQAVQPIFTEFEELDARQRAYGFQVCGSEDTGE